MEGDLEGDPKKAMKGKKKSIPVNLKKVNEQKS